MGEKVTFPANGHTCEGWFDSPASGKGPAVVVIQEWWGLVPHIKDLVERFAAAGFVAVAPDLYHGKTTSSPDAAGKLLMEMDGARAGQEIAAAGSFLLSRPECGSARYGVVGFCMGGALAQYAACNDPNVGAAVSFYGGFKQLPIAWEKLAAPILLIYGEKDEGVPASQAKPLEAKLKALGKEVETMVYPDAGHAFFNDDRPQAYKKDAAEDAWRRTLELFRKNLA